ncbi:MAG: spermidine synthase [Pseudomonadales bacterium]
MAIPGKEIYRSHDEYGPVQVYDDGNKRYLAFGNEDQQSCSLKAEPYRLQHDYTQAMLLSLLFVDPKEVIILGLGGGSMVSALLHHIDDLNIRAVELRPAVADIAYQYFQLPRDPRLEIVIDDACDYVAGSQIQKADIIFGDLYDSEGLHTGQLQSTFICDCNRILSDKGWLVLNCWQDHRGESRALQALKTLFSDVRVCNTPEGNWIILAGKQRSPHSDKQLNQRARELSGKLGFSLTSLLNRLSKPNKR